MVSTIKTVSYWISYFWKILNRLRSDMPFLSLPKFELQRFLRALKPYLLCQKTFWYKNAFKTTTLWFFGFWGFFFPHGSSTKMSRKLILLFTFFWVGTALGFPIRCPHLHPAASGCVCLRLSIPLCNVYQKEMFIAVFFDNLWSLSCQCSVLSTWLPALECGVKLLL